MAFCLWTASLFLLWWYKTWYCEIRQKVLAPSAVRCSHSSIVFNWNLLLWSQESYRDKDLSSAFLGDLFRRICCHWDDTIYPQSIWQCSMTICFAFSLGVRTVSKWHTRSYHFGSPGVQYRSLLSTNCDFYQLLRQMSAFLHSASGLFIFQLRS